MKIKDYIPKIEAIFNKYVSKKANVWNLGTNIFNTWILLNKYLLESHLNNVTKIEVKEVANPHPDRDYKVEPTKYGIILANGINITPARGNNHENWSEGGIRQFLQEGSAMNIVMYNEHDSVFDSFDVTAEFNDVCETLDDAWWLKKIKNLILHSLLSNQKHVVNLGFTLFYVLVCKIFPTIFNDFKNPITLRYQVRRAGILNNWDITGQSAIDEANRMYDEKDTYKGLANVILNNVNKENLLIDIVNDVYSIAFEQNDEEQEIKIPSNIQFESMTRAQQLQSILDALASYRGLFRDNLLENRGKTNLEIVPMDIVKKDGTPIKSIIETLEAAHIYECREIRKNLIEKFHNNALSQHDIQQFCSDIQNPQNGLLLDSNLHKAFDKRVFSFNIEGDIVFNKEDLDKIKLLGIECAHIDTNVLTQEMKNFILKR